MASDVDSMVMELLAGKGRLNIDNEDLPVWVTVTTGGRQRVVAGGSIAEALHRACLSLKSKAKEEVSDG